MGQRITESNEKKLEQLIRQAIEQVLRKNSRKDNCLWIIERPPKNGYVLDHAFKIHSEEYQIDILPCSGELGLINEKRLARSGHRLVGWPADWDTPVNYSLICLFNPSLKTLSKLANLIIDDQITELIFDFLQKGSTVQMDAWTERQEFCQLPKGLQQKIAGLLSDLESFGITQKSFGTLEQQVAQVVEVPNKGIMSLEDLKIAIQNGQDPAKLEKNVRLTPLAIDYLQDLQRAGDSGKRWRHE